MDLGPINEVLGLATTALGATGKAVSTVEAIKGLFAPGKTPDSGEASKLLNGLAADLTAANLMNVQLSESLRALAAELRRVDDFEKEKDRYELFETSERDIVFALKGSMANGQPSHYVCPVCMNRDKLISYITGEGDHKVCQANSTHTFRFRATAWIQPVRARTDWSPHDY